MLLNPLAIVLAKLLHHRVVEELPHLGLPPMFIKTIDICDGKETDRGFGKKGFTGLTSPSCRCCRD